MAGKYSGFGYGFNPMAGDITGDLSDKTSAFPYITWKVSNQFFNWNVSDFFFRSPEFKYAFDSWRLKVEPYYFLKSSPGLNVGLIGINYSTEDRVIKISLERLVSAVPERSCFVTIGLQTIIGQPVLCRSYCSFTGNPPNELVVAYVRRSDFHNASQFFATNGKVTVCWDMASDSVDTVLTKVVQLQNKLARVGILQSDYKKLVESGAESDVCLAVSGKEFRAHKCILKARSPVFRAMFDHETEEKASGKVNIIDLDPDSFQNFLEYVYAGRVEAISDENVFKMYVAADKYDVQTLKFECLEYMRRWLSVDSFCDVMALSLRYKEKELMNLATYFFKMNIREIITTVKWQRFLGENHVIANDLLIKALPANDKS